MRKCKWFLKIEEEMRKILEKPGEVEGEGCEEDEAVVASKNSLY